MYIKNNTINVKNKCEKNINTFFSSIFDTFFSLRFL